MLMEIHTVGVGVVYKRDFTGFKRVGLSDKHNYDINPNKSLTADKSGRQLLFTEMVLRALFP